MFEDDETQEAPAADQTGMNIVDYQTLVDVMTEIQDQPPWRQQADKEADYCDGNQLDTEILQKLDSLGMKPTIENMIGPAIEDICGMEAKNRTDWLVSADADDDPEADAVAKAVAYRLKQAESRSGADRALTKGYEALAKVGMGWIEVSRESDPFRFPYRVRYIHRNEIWYDWFAKEDDLSDARWMLRRRWVDIEDACRAFPDKAELIRAAGNGWARLDELTALSADTGASTTLMQSQDIERGFSIEEQEWRDILSKRVCLFHLITTDMRDEIVLKESNGRASVFDIENEAHINAVVNGATLDRAVVKKYVETIFFGPHIILQKECEFNRFPWVAMFGKREDRTRVPYGTIRWLMPLQDEFNARITKQKWLLASTRTTRTKGAAIMSDEVLRHEVGRPDADIVLDPKAMAQPGAKFEVTQDMTLTQQQVERLNDIRVSFQRISGVSSAMSGDGGPDTASGLSQMIEQSVQSLAKLNDNFTYARTQVGELLLFLIVKDIGDQQQSVTIKGNGLRDSETIVLNAQYEDGSPGLSNSVQRTMLKVELSDVPTTPTFRQQQLTALSEVMKSSPPQYQGVMMPHFMHLTNIPKDEKEDIVKSIVAINKNAMMTEDQVQERIKQAIDQERTKWMVDLKGREVAIKEKQVDATTQEIIQRTVKLAIDSIYSATQAGMQIASVPAVAPVADQVLRSAGFQDQDAAPIVAPVQMAQQPVQVGSDSHPNIVDSPGLVADPGTNMPAPPSMGPTAGTGEEAGIEKIGAQV